MLWQFMVHQFSKSSNSKPSRSFSFNLNSDSQRTDSWFHSMILKNLSSYTYASSIRFLWSFVILSTCQSPQNIFFIWSFDLHFILLTKFTSEATLYCVRFLGFLCKTAIFTLRLWLIFGDILMPFLNPSTKHYVWYWIAATLIAPSRLWLDSNM